MRTYILKRLMQMPITLIGVTLIIFCITRLAPGDPAAAKLGVGGGNMGSQDAAKELIEKFRKDWNLDKPIPVQYMIWIGNMVKLDFGRSFKDKRPVGEKIVERMPVTITLNFISFFLIYLIAIPIGIFSAVKKGTLIDKIVSTFLFILYSLPNFFVATLCILYFCNAEQYLKIFPVAGLKSDEYDASEIMRFGPLPVADGDLQSGIRLPYNGEVLEVRASLLDGGSTSGTTEVSIELDGADVTGGKVGLSRAVGAQTGSDSTTAGFAFREGSLLDIEARATAGLGAGDSVNVEVMVVRRASFLEWLLDRLWHLVLPVLCMTYGGLAYISRQQRGAMLEVIRQDYVRTARAKGLSEWTVVLKHALRNALIPIITLIATLLPLMIAGSVIIEQIFTLRGLGKLSFEAITGRDYNVILAIFTLSSLLTMLGILIADILYAVVNPTIKLR